MMISFLRVLFLLVSFSFSNVSVFSIQDSLYYESDLSAFYGLGEWNRASLEQKNKMIDDFIVREGSFLLGKKNLLHFSPSFVQKKHNKERQLLVNYVYQRDVSFLGKDSLRYLQGLSFLKKDFLLHHVLFGFEGSSLRVPVSRSKDEAYFLCSSVLDTLSFAGLPALASRLSDDGSAKRNFGRLGWVSWGSTVPSFELEVFQGEVGSFVGSIETDFGFHVAYIEASRPSSFSFLSQEEFEDAVLLRSSVRSPAELKALSSSYDSLVLDRSGLVFNDSLVGEIFSSFKGLSKEKINKNDIISVLKNIKAPGVVCVFKGEAFGLGWFIDRLAFFDPSNRPNIQDLSSLFSILKTLLLQESAYIKGLSLKYFDRGGFKKQLLSFEKDLLYTLYFKNLVNSVPFPDSLSVENYYFKNQDKKYKTQKALKLVEIRVPRKALADSLLSLYIEGEDFLLLAERFSLGFSKKTKGLIGPVEKNFKKGKLLAFFKESLKVGHVDNVVENADGTFSVYKINRIYPSSYISLNKAFSRISSLLHRENQETAKREAIQLFNKELNIVKNDSLF